MYSIEHRTGEVQLILFNDEGLYNMTIEYIGSTKKPTYQGLLNYACLETVKVPYNDFYFVDVDFDEMDSFLETEKEEHERGKDERDSI